MYKDEENIDEMIVKSCVTAGIAGKDVKIVTESGKLFGDDLKQLMISELSEAEADKEIVLALEEEEVSDMIKSVTDALTDGTITNEYAEETAEYNPIVLTIQTANAKKTLTRESAIGTWAPLKSLPANATSFVINMPADEVSRLEKGKLVEKHNVATHKNYRPDVDTTPRAIPTKVDENASYFHGETVRTGTLPGTETGAFVFGKVIDIADACSEQVDPAGGTLDFTDILLEGGKIDVFNITIKDGVNPDEVIRIETSATINDNNRFTTPVGGKVKENAIAAEFAFAITKATVVQVANESVASVATSAILAALDTGAVYKARVNIDGSNSLISNTINMRSGTLTIEGYMVDGVVTPLTTSDAIKDITFEVTSYEPSLYLTNGNDRGVGLFITDTDIDYPFSVDPKGIMHKALPKADSASRKGDTASKALAINNVLTRQDMEIAFIVGLKGHVTLIKQSQVLGTAPGLVTDAILKPVYLEESLSGVSPVVMRTSDNLEQVRSIKEQAIEKMAKELVEKSQFRNIDLLGANSYFVRVLTKVDDNLVDFTMTNGVKVKVDYSHYVGEDSWVTLEANGGPVINGVKILQLATMLTVNTVTSVGVRYVGTSSHKVITFKPAYDPIFLTPVLGRLF